MLKKIVVLLVCLSSEPFFSQDFYALSYGSNSNVLIKMNPFSCNYLPLSICQPTYESPYSGDPPYLDIAVDRQYVYSVTSKGTLYRQDLTSPLNCQNLGSFGYLVNALVADSTGILYGIGEDSSGLTSYLFRYSANTFSNLGPLPPTFRSTGDLFFYEHRLFLTTYSVNPNPLMSDDQFLVEIDMTNPSLSCIYMRLPLPPAIGYWAAFSIWDGVRSQVFTQVNNGIQEIDMKCKSLGAVTCSILSGGCRGFASWYPFTSSNAASNCHTVAASLASSTTQICRGEAATLTALGWGTYTWSVPGNQQSIVVSPLSTTMYSISGTNSTGCPTTVSATINVISRPQVTILGQTTLCPGSAISLTATGAQSYSWSTGALTPQINMVSQGDTVFSVTGTGSNGCKTWVLFPVTMFDCVGLGETDIASTTVFPNPSTGQFECISDAFIRDVKVFDGLSREVKRINNCGTRVTITDLKPGIYFILLTTERSIQTIRHIVME